MSRNIEAISKNTISDTEVRNKKTNQTSNPSVKAEFLDLINSLVSYQSQANNELVHMLSDLASTPLPEEKPQPKIAKKDPKEEQNSSSDVAIAIAVSSSQVSSVKEAPVEKPPEPTQSPKENESSKVVEKKVADKPAQDQPATQDNKTPTPTSTPTPMPAPAPVEQDLSQQELSNVAQVLDDKKTVTKPSDKTSRPDLSTETNSIVDQAVANVQEQSQQPEAENLANIQQNQQFQAVDQNKDSTKSSSKVLEQVATVPVDTTSQDLKPQMSAPQLKIELEILSRAAQFISHVSDSLSSSQQTLTTNKQNSSLAISAMGEAKNGGGVGSEAKRIVLTKPVVSHMLEKVEQAVRESVKKKDANTLSFKLDPPELGQMRVDVKLKDGALQAKLSPESQQVTAYLREHASDLQGLLRKLGLEVQSVTVSVSSELNSSVTQDAGMSSEQYQSFGQEMQDKGGSNSNDGNLPKSGKDLANTNSETNNDHWVA